MIEGQRIMRCPLLPFYEDPEGMSELLWYYRNFKKGTLPVEGGLLDQPGLMMELFKIIDNAVATLEAAQQAELDKERRADIARRNRRAASG